MFADFGEPIAAASLAQAHPATLADGRKVAVKVLRPGIERRIAQDVAALTLAARLVEAMVPPARRLEPKAFVATVARSLELELDLRFEAAGASELAEIMDKDGYMRAPDVVWIGVARRVMTLTWAEGMPLSDPASLGQMGQKNACWSTTRCGRFSPRRWTMASFTPTCMRVIFSLARRWRWTAVDFGIVGRLDHTARKHLAEILWGFLRRDYLRVARAPPSILGHVPPHHSAEAFAQALRAVGEPNVGRPAREVAEMGRLPRPGLFEITAMFDMRLRPELVLLQKTMVTVEGVARRIDPDHSLWAAAEPVVQRWITRELSPAAQVRDLVLDARDALKALARMADQPTAPATTPEPPPRPSRLGWFALGVAASGLAFVLAAWASHHP